MRVLAVLLLLVAPALADTWKPWREKRVTDPAGRYYVVLREAPWGLRGVRYAFAEVEALAPPVQDEEYRTSRLKGPTWSVGSGLREGDPVIRSGGLEYQPYEVMVSATGLGFLCMESWIFFGSGNSVSIVSADGAPVIVLELSDLFPPRQIARFPRSFSSTWWYRGAWIDDEARKVVVVAVDGSIRTVDWKDGTVGEGTEDDIVRALALPYDKARTLALELVAERRIEAGRAASTALFEDGLELPSIRLRAATALAALGDLRGKDFVVSHADLERSIADDDLANFAFAQLPHFLGEEAIPKLTTALRKGSSGARSGFIALGRRAVPALVMLVSEDANRDAINALRLLGARESVPALAQALHATDSEWRAQAALEAIDDLLEPEERIPWLLEAMRAGTPILDEIAREFQEVLCPASVPLLVAALEAAPLDDNGWGSRQILLALIFQTAKNLGTDPAAWRAWLDEGK